MKSYGTVDRKEGEFIVCEVELLEAQNSNSEDFFEHETVMIDVPTKTIETVTGVIKEDEVILVEHDGETVSLVYGKDDSEKQRRIEVIAKL